MTGNREENSIEADDPAEHRAGDPNVENHQAIRARERTGGAYPDGDAVKAMEEPLRRLTSAAVVFRDVTTESTEGAALRIRNLLAGMMCRDAIRLFRLISRASAAVLLKRAVFRGISP